LNHPNIVAVYDFGKAGDFYYFIMEYVDGMNLCQLEATKEKLDPEQALAIIPKICEALQYAHDEGIVHRDIKPGNILIDKKGRVKIADFGLAKLLSKPAELMLTQSQALLGTPLYMAPEQLSDPQKVDHRADIYSLGVVFYEMLTGDLPMGRFAPPSQKAQIDVRLDEVVLRTLEREPERRYQHAGDVKTDIDQLSTSAAAKEKARVSGAHAQRIWIAGASALLVVLSVLAGVHFWPRTQKNEQLDKGLPPSAAMDHAGHPATQTPSGGRIVKSFAAADRPISGELVATLNDGWLATCASTQTFRLFEVPTPGLENCVLTYQAQLKTEGLEGRAYLEMWCQFPGRGEFFSRGLDNTVSGSTDWTTCQTPFFSKVGEKVDRVRLNLVVEGRGKVFIKDIQLYSAPHQ